MLASYHNHTYRCKHAIGTEEEYVLHAIKHGYGIFGFSDHAPHLVADDISGSRMSPGELPGYVSTLCELRERYKSDIDIRIGLELEYYPKTHAADMQMYREAGIEYLILGQHLIRNGVSPDSIHCFSLTDEREKYTLYVNQTIEAMSTGHFSCFAHPDVFKYVGDNDFYRQESDRLIRAAIQHAIPLEVNMYGLSDGRHYPNPLFWERASRLGAAVVLGRDAHSVHRVHAPEEFGAAYRFIEKYKLDLIDEVPLRPIS